MRKDMFEVIIERPRYGSHGRFRKGRRQENSERAFERAPKYQGIRGGGLTTSLNENLAPLVRYLDRQVGRPWNKVRSEMSAVISVKSAVQKHVLDHLRDYVEENVVLIDGLPYALARYGGPAPIEASDRPQFYVCPKTGMLRRAKLIARKKRTPR